MWYAIMSTDTGGALRRRMAVQGLHMARLKKLEDEGRLLLAGPCPAAESAHGAGRAGFVGNIIVARFDSLKQAQDWSDADPFWEAGVHGSVDVRPFHPVLP